jgi:hypothetical protein
MIPHIFDSSDSIPYSLHKKRALNALDIGKAAWFPAHCMANGPYQASFQAMQTKRIVIARCRLSRPSPGVFRHALSAGDSAAGHPPKTSMNPALVKSAISNERNSPTSGALCNCGPF